MNGHKTLTANFYRKLKIEQKREPVENPQPKPEPIEKPQITINTGSAAVEKSQPEPKPADKPQATVSAGRAAETVFDNRDRKKYKTTLIGGKRWMAENLNYHPRSGKSWCYKNYGSNCDKYGRLYDWNTAMTVCPSGWHLPSRAEWKQLAKTAGDATDYGYSGTAGMALKSTGGWSNKGNGTDEFGFSALPGGYRSGSDGNFLNIGNRSYWWTATEYSSGTAYHRSIYYNHSYMNESNYNFKNDGFSIRCVADN
jgi:uncharacterized protein (TIGR02145 family)